MLDLGTSSDLYGAACIVLLVVISFCAAAGIGGGGLNVPILILICNYSLKSSQKLSYCLLLGSYSSQLWVNYSKPHPLNPTKPVISYDIALAFLPIQLAGNNVGIILNAIFPDSVVYVVALVVVLFSAYISYTKAIHYYQKESDALAVADANNPTVALIDSNGFKSDNESVENQNSDENASFGSQSTASDASSGAVKAKRRDSKDRRILYPRYTIVALLLIWAVYVMLATVSKVYQCTPASFIALGLLFAFLLIATSASIYSLRHQIRSNASIKPDIDFDQNTVLPICCAFLIGTLSSILGIGGSELGVPLLLWLQVEPLVASSTVPYMSFLSNGSNLVIYTVTGKNNIDETRSILCTYFLHRLLSCCCQQLSHPYNIFLLFSVYVYNGYVHHMIIYIFYFNNHPHPVCQVKSTGKAAGFSSSSAS